MTTIRVRLALRNVDAKAGRVQTSGAVQFRPTVRRTDDGDVILPKPFTQVLRGGQEPPVVEFEVDDAATWAWEALERVTNGRGDWVTFTVSDVDPVEADYDIDYCDLTIVDPDTLTPITEAPVTVQQQLNALDENKANTADLGSAAAEDVGAFATAAQGGKADDADTTITSGRLSEASLNGTYATRVAPDFFGDVDIVSTFDGGYNTADSTSRINTYSSQKASSPNHFGETLRMYVERKQAKNVIAWYSAPGFNEDGTPAGDAVAVAWIHAHYGANSDSDEASGVNKKHRHIEIETPDSTGALIGRFEIGIWNRQTGAFLDQSFAQFNATDLLVGSGNRLILAGINSRAKQIEWGVSDPDLGQANPWGLTRFKLELSTATETATNSDGSNLRFLAQYGETVAGKAAPNSRTVMLLERGGNQRVGVGPYLVRDLPGGKFEAINSTTTIPTLRALARHQTTSGRGALEASMYTPTNPALQCFGQTSGDGGTTWTEDSQAYFRMLGTGAMEWGAGGASSRDTYLARAEAGVLETTGAYRSKRGSNSGVAFSTRNSSDSYDRLQILIGNGITMGGGSAAPDVALSRAASTAFSCSADMRFASGRGPVLIDRGDASLKRLVVTNGVLSVE